MEHLIVIKAYGYKLTFLTVTVVLGYTTHIFMICPNLFTVSAFENKVACES